MWSLIKHLMYATAAFVCGGIVFFIGGIMLAFFCIASDSQREERAFEFSIISYKLGDFLNSKSAKSEFFTINEFNDGVFSILSKKQNAKNVQVFEAPPVFIIEGDSLVSVQAFELNAISRSVPLDVKIYYNSNLEVKYAYVGKAKIPTFMVGVLPCKNLETLGLTNIKSIKTSPTGLTLYK